MSARTPKWAWAPPGWQRKPVMISSKIRATPLSSVSRRNWCRKSLGCSSGLRLCTGSTRTAANSCACSAMKSSERAIAVLEHVDVGQGVRQDACGDRHELRAAPRSARAPAPRRRCRGRSPANMHDLVAVRRGAGDAQRGEYGLRAGVAERGPLGAGEPADGGGDLTRQRRLRPDLDTSAELLLQCSGHEVGRVPEQIGAEPHHQIDVLVAVHVTEPGPRRALRRRWGRPSPSTAGESRPRREGRHSGHGAPERSASIAPCGACSARSAARDRSRCSGGQFHRFCRRGRLDGGRLERSSSAGRATLVRSVLLRGKVLSQAREGGKVLLDLAKADEHAEAALNLHARLGQSEGVQPQLRNGGGRAAFAPADRPESS